MSDGGLASDDDADYFLPHQAAAKVLVKHNLLKKYSADDQHTKPWTVGVRPCLRDQEELCACGCYTASYHKRSPGSKPLPRTHLTQAGQPAVRPWRLSKRLSRKERFTRAGGGENARKAAPLTREQAAEARAAMREDVLLHRERQKAWHKDVCKLCRPYNQQV